MARIIYQDKLIAITEDEIIFEKYYFPTMQRKVVRLTDIERITAEPATIWNGKWRIQGTGNLRTWYPWDPERSTRDKIFFAVLKKRQIRIGFTVEDSLQVERILKDKLLIAS